MIGPRVAASVFESGSKLCCAPFAFLEKFARVLRSSLQTDESSNKVQVDYTEEHDVEDDPEREAANQKNRDEVLHIVVAVAFIKGQRDEREGLGPKHRGAVTVDDEES